MKYGLLKEWIEHYATLFHVYIVGDAMKAHTACMCKQKLVFHIWKIDMSNMSTHLVIRCNIIFNTFWHKIWRLYFIEGMADLKLFTAEQAKCPIPATSSCLKQSMSQTDGSQRCTGYIWFGVTLCVHKYMKYKLAYTLKSALAPHPFSRCEIEK